MVVTALERVATVSETALTSVLTASSAGLPAAVAAFTVVVTVADFTGSGAFVGLVKPVANQGPTIAVAGVMVTVPVPPVEFPITVIEASPVVAAVLAEAEEAKPPRSVAPVAATLKASAGVPTGLPNTSVTLTLTTL